jgi:hypothetical protein
MLRPARLVALTIVSLVVAMLCPVTALAQGPAAAPADPFAGVNEPHPFLIIAPDEFMAALEPLVTHKNAIGMATLAVTIRQLTTHFPGVDDPEKIKRGIQYAHEHLGTQYVMLVGDPHWFPVRFIFFKNFSRSYPNHPNEPNLPVDGVYAPSDLYYANLYHHKIARSPKLVVAPGPFDDWNADRTGHYNAADWGLSSPARTNWNEPNPDRVDGYPDVAVARATAHSAADVTAYVNKIIRYETQKPTTPLFTFVADGKYPGAPPPRRTDSCEVAFELSRRLLPNQQARRDRVQPLDHQCLPVRRGW